MNNLDLTRWLLKVRDALAEQDEAKRNSMLRAADRIPEGNNQSLRGTGIDKSRRTGSPNQFDQASECDDPAKQPLRNLQRGACCSASIPGASLVILGRVPKSRPGGKAEPCPFT